jgi:hypothetical protein
LYSRIEHTAIWSRILEDGAVRASAGPTTADP